MKQQPENGNLTDAAPRNRKSEDHRQRRRSRNEETLLESGFIKLNFHRWTAVLGKHPPGGVPPMTRLGYNPLFSLMFSSLNEKLKLIPCDQGEWTQTTNYAKLLTFPMKAFLVF